MDLQEIAKQYRDFKTSCDEEYRRRVEWCAKATESTRKEMIKRDLPIGLTGQVNPLPVDDSFEAFLLQLAPTQQTK